MAIAIPVTTCAALIEAAKFKPGTFLWIHSPTHLAFGVLPQVPERLLDIGAEQMIGANSVPTLAPLTPIDAPAPRKRMIAASGKYMFELLGNAEASDSLKEMLGRALVAIEKKRPGMLIELAKHKGRTKRIVAQDPKRLFDNNQALVSKYAEKLMDGWYYGTNNSTEETKTWLRRACECANLKWGVDFDISI